jgi:hypothetical protein
MNATVADGKLGPQMKSGENSLSAFHLLHRNRILRCPQWAQWKPDSRIRKCQPENQLSVSEWPGADIQTCEFISQAWPDL